MSVPLGEFLVVHLVVAMLVLLMALVVELVYWRPRR